MSRRRSLATRAWALGAVVAAGACGSHNGGNTTGAAGAGGNTSGAAGAGGAALSCSTDAGTTTLPRSLGCLDPAFTANGVSIGSFRRSLLSPCAADGGCPADQVCFHLTAEIALCDVPQQAPTDAVCSPACDVGQRCNPPFAGVPCYPTSSYCSDTACASASDCGDGTVCTPPSLVHIGPWGPGRCVARRCESDADCTSGPNGRCVLVHSLGSGAACNGPVLGDVSVGCVYAGSPMDPNACPGAWACGDGCSHTCP